MECVPLYHAVPSIELDEPHDCRPSTHRGASIAPGHGGAADLLPSAPSPLGRFRRDTTTHLDRMRRYLNDLTNSACGCMSSPELSLPTPEEGMALEEVGRPWRCGASVGEALRRIPGHGGWDDRLSSTNSAPSDPAFSPASEMAPSTLFQDEAGLTSALWEPRYPLAMVGSDPLYLPYGSTSGTLVASPAGSEPTIACSMQELQYDPDPKNEEMVAGNDVLPLETCPPLLDGWTGHSPGPQQMSHHEPTTADIASAPGVEPETESMDLDPKPTLRLPPRQRARQPRRHDTATSPPPFVSPRNVLRSNTAVHRVGKMTRPKPVAINKKKSDGRNKGVNSKGKARPFVCAFSHYGCHSSFAFKNEWKRHVSSKHLQLGFYRCDTGQCMPRASGVAGGGDGPGNTDLAAADTRPTFNDFNRKDLFTQHHRRMHTPWSPSPLPPNSAAQHEFELGLEAVRQRCWRTMRKPPSRSQCTFCPAAFSGDGAWEERMEHIGRHIEEADREQRSIGSGREDVELRAWALREGIIVFSPESGFCVLRDHYPDRQPGERSRPRRGSSARSGRASGNHAIASSLEEDALGEDE